MRDRHFGDIMAALKSRYRERAASAKATPWESLLFTMLTARSRDEQVEPVFRRLMAKYPTPGALAAAKVADVAEEIRTIGLYKEKAKNAVAMARAIVERHGGVVPNSMTALVELPGVGRKTASCVLVYAFGVPAVAVDTHVHRISNRLGWVKTKTPTQTEMALRKSLPAQYWLDVNRVMVQFGRDICLPGVPKCWLCPARKWCAFPSKTEAPSRDRLKGK